MSVRAGHVAPNFGCPSGIGKIILSVVALLTAVLFAISCGSIPGVQSAQAAASSPIAVNISPASPHVSPGGAVQFTATLTGTSNVAVVWSATGGAITNGGMFTSSKTANSATVTATSVANPQATASTPVIFASTQLAISSTSLPPANSGTPYNASLVSTGGTPAYTWNIAAGNLPAGLTLSPDGTIAGTPVQPGSYSFGVKVTDIASQTASVSLGLKVQNSVSNYTGFDGPAELPRSYMKTAMADTPAPGPVISVNAGGDLQAAFNKANCGDTIQLQAGAVFTGNFTLPAVNCDDQHWIIIRTSAPDSALPAEHTRVTPCYAGVASLPGRPAYTCPNPRNVLAKIQLDQTGLILGPIQFLNGANHYRFIGLEITTAQGVNATVNLIGVQDAKLGAADHIIVDRSWVHGPVQDEVRRGFALRNITQAGIVDSYFSDFHCTAVSGTCVESNDIGGGSGDLPQTTWSIVNNFLEASGESILLGGGPATITPTDIEIRRNHFFKPLNWLKGSSGFVGGKGGHPFIVKNHIEFKNAQRVLIEGNIFENNWGGFSQHGHSIVLTPRNNYSGLTHVNNCWTCKVADITIRYSTISHVGAGLNLANVLTRGEPAAPGGRYSIHDITVDDLEGKALNSGGDLFMIMSHWPKTALSDVQITHVTAFPGPDGRILAIASPAKGPKMTGFVFAHNIITVPGLPIFGADLGHLNCDTHASPISGLEGCFPGYVFLDNLLIAPPLKFSGQWPNNNVFPTSVTSTEFVDYHHAVDGNYALSASSPYKTRNGADPGADIAAINAAIAGVQ